MNSDDLGHLLGQSEGSKLDFKRANYRFHGGSDVEKSELLKDIIAIANSDPKVDGHIVVGVEEVDGRANRVIGAEPILQDHEIQEFVNSKTNRPVEFSVVHCVYNEAQLTVIKIAAQQAKPIFLREAYGRLRSKASSRGVSAETASYN